MYVNEFFSYGLCLFLSVSFNSLWLNLKKHFLIPFARGFTNVLRRIQEKSMENAINPKNICDGENTFVGRVYSSSFDNMLVNMLKYTS